MSLTTTSGVCASKRSSASSTDDASVTVAPYSRSRSATNSRASVSSSTRSTRAPASTPRRAATGRRVGVTRRGGATLGTRTRCVGSVSVKVAPLPSPALSAAMAPPCSSTRCRAIARPRPIPLCRRVLELSAWRKRSKTWGRKAASMPCPVSATRTLTSSSPRVADTVTAPPAGVNFTAFHARFHTTCWRRPGSPWTTPRSSSVWRRPDAPKKSVSAPAVRPCITSGTESIERKASARSSARCPSEPATSRYHTSSTSGCSAARPDESAQTFTSSRSQRVQRVGARRASTRASPGAVTMRRVWVMKRRPRRGGG